ncbi:MAG: KpsF/GutQ family sugar-phosphate isomerase [Pseudomonadota bacterium]
MTSFCTVSDATSSDMLDRARQVIRIEADAVRQLEAQLDESFVSACQAILACNGRVIVIGMGKSGHIGHKIAATLASTGTPAFFVHPAEASHGDLGMLTPADVVLALSHSGETAELLTILPLIKRLGIPLISLTGNQDSTLAKQADISLTLNISREACPLDLAPTASTTAALVMGDALAVVLLQARGFTPEDFALSHPGGSLGRRLLLRASDVMHTGERIPQVSADASMSAALIEMSAKGLGMTAVVSQQDQVLGVFTDGDLRRCLANQQDLYQASIDALMTRPGLHIHPDKLAAEALKLMQDQQVNALLVIDNNKLVGAVHMHDLLAAGVV